MTDDEARRAKVADLEARNAAMLKRVKASGIVIRPTHLDRLPDPHKPLIGRRDD